MGNSDSSGTGGRMPATNEVRGLALAVDTVGEGICITAPGHRIQYVNPALAHMLGYQPQELIGQPFFSLYPRGDDHPRHREIVDRLSTGEWSGEVELLTKNGGLVHTNQIATPMRDEAGSLIGCVYIITDIIESKRARARDRMRVAAIDNMPNGLVIWRLDDLDDAGSLRIVFANRAVMQHNGGIPPEALVGKTARGDFPELVDSGVAETYAQVVRTGDKANLPEMYYDSESYPQARETYWSVKAFPVPDQSVGIIVENITGQKRAERALRESEERYRLVFDESPMGIGIADEDGRLIAINDAITEMLGYTEEELLGRRIADITHPDDIKLNMDLLQKAIRGETRKYEMEKRYIAKDNKTVWARLVGTVIRDDAGQPRYVLGTLENISERKKAQELARETEERYRVLVESASDAIFTVERNMIIVSWNQSAEAMFGWNEEETIGKPLTMVVPASLRDRFEEAWRQMVSEQSPPTAGRTAQVLGLNKDGNEFWAEISYGSWSGRGRAFYTAIVRDITERQLADEEIRRLAVAVETVRNAVIIAGMNGRISFVNRAAKHMLGYSPGELLGMSVHDVHPESLRETTAREIFEATRNDGCWTGEVPLVSKTGKEFSPSG